jgi:hypothetical protein
VSSKGGPSGCAVVLTAKHQQPVIAGHCQVPWDALFPLTRQGRWRLSLKPNLAIDGGEYEMVTVDSAASRHRPAKNALNGTFIPCAGNYSIYEIDAQEPLVSHCLEAQANATVSQDGNDACSDSLGR